MARRFTHTLGNAPGSPATARTRPPRTTAQDGQAAASTDPQTLSTKVLHQIDELRRPFAAFLVDYGTLEATRSALAPRFMKAFVAYEKETQGSFIAFCRVLDPRIPGDRDGYKAHPAYRAADYLRRLVARDAHPKSDIPESERPVTPLVALARLVATVLPLVDVNGQVWRAFVAEMHWSDAQAERLQKLAATEGGVKLAPRTVHQLRKAA